MKKIIGFISKITNSGLIKPLPLTGLAKEWAKVKESKNYLRFAAYALGGIVLYGIIWRGLPVAEGIELLKILF